MSDQRRDLRPFPALVTPRWPGRRWCCGKCSHPCSHTTLKLLVLHFYLAPCFLPSVSLHRAKGLEGRVGWREGPGGAWLQGVPFCSPQPSLLCRHQDFSCVPWVEELRKEKPLFG